MSESETLQLVIPPHLAGQRLDQALAELVPDYSRARLKQWIKAGRVTLNGENCRPRDKLRGNEKVVLQVEHEAQTDWVAEDVPIDIVYEDEAIIIINSKRTNRIHKISPIITIQRRNPVIMANIKSAVTVGTKCMNWIINRGSRYIERAPLNTIKPISPVIFPSNIHAPRGAIFYICLSSISIA